jgi:hypothetical protein
MTGIVVIPDVGDAALPPRLNDGCSIGRAVGDAVGLKGVALAPDPPTPLTVLVLAFGLAAGVAPC